MREWTDYQVLKLGDGTPKLIKIFATLSEASDFILSRKDRDSLVVRFADKKKIKAVY